ncbi:type IV secretory system conjugative DNA transfer family protein [Pectobacterium aroidearum]|uniref:type IV secretory system conjugative DNA transfer family protein n=1 Tax=Pectobacterium aroidearum TaxID=1201031 RepID=UPI0031592CD9
MKSLISIFIPIILLTGCTNSQSPGPVQHGAAPPDIHAWLNPKRQRPEGLSDTRWQMLTEAGKTLGFRGGKAQRAWELTLALTARESTLNALYDFRPIISPEGWLPPVIDEAQDVAHITPDQIRTSTKVWTIIRPERFVSNPPNWRNWLLRGLATTATPGTEGLVTPEDSTQREVWEEALKKGWHEGRENADLTLEANMNQLTRDYRGMMLYSLLWRQGMITRPEVSEQQQTVTGTGQKLVTGDRVRRLKTHASFELQKSRWRPAITIEKGAPLHEPAGSTQ